MSPWRLNRRRSWPYRRNMRRAAQPLPCHYDSGITQKAAKSFAAFCKYRSLAVFKADQEYLSLDGTDLLLCSVAQPQNTQGAHQVSDVLTDSLRRHHQ